MARRTDPPRLEDDLPELIRRCEVSRQQRRTTYEMLEAWYERGTAEGPRAKANKLRSHLDRVASYIFAPDTVRFGVHLPPAVRETWNSAASVARDEFRQVWHSSGTDLVVSALLEWALVYGATIAKVQADPHTGFRSGYIAPWDFGVSREDVPQIDEQDTITHRYTLSIPQITRWLAANPEVETDRLLAIANEHKSTNRGSGSKQGLVISNVTGVFPGGTVQGGFPGEPDTTADIMGAVVDEPLVEFVDLWQRKMFRRRTWQDQQGEYFEDWRVTTLIADADVLFVRRRNPDLPWTRTGKHIVLPGELPFTVLAPRPHPRYFWGRSELSDIRRIQDWLEDHLDDMKMIMKRKLDPAKFFSGVPDWEEAGRAMSTEGGGFSGTPEPGGKMDSIKVELGQEAFEMYKIILSLLADASGIPESLSEPGNIPGGVRSEGHFGMVAGIGAGRIRRMALIVEDPLGDIATKGFHILQRHDTQLYPRPDGTPFLLSQLPPELSFRVSAHSASPIYAEQTQAKGLMLHKSGAVDGEDLVEMVDPPNREELKLKAREIAKRKAETQAELLQIQHEKAQKGKLKLPKG